MRKVIQSYLLSFIFRDEMDLEKTSNKADVLHEFQVSFFAMSRLVTFPWSSLERELENDKSSELILDILKQTCLHPLCQKHPPSIKYRRLFVTELIRRHESAELEPLDELYEALGQVVGAKEGTNCYKTYLLPCGDAVSLSESVAVISEGTTGLVTWEAGLYLAEWAMDNQQAFTDRVVLELGSGVGLTGITVCRSCSPSRYVFSDCHPSVLQKLRYNIWLNKLADQDCPRVCVEQLDWDTVTEQQLTEIGANTVIAADVVYDPDIIGCLVKLLSRLLSCSSPPGPPDILISSTLRNLGTYNSFKHQLESAGISHKVITEPVRHVFPYNRGSAIELIKLHF
uniref:Eukaryotic elongation factor 2 lysine methyltransferase n=1 Tax=Myripristis murdjan TaxID=586833 RepID=A0A667X9B9_9TELE